MGGQLKDQQERIGRYNPILTITLFNAEATRANILLALKRLAGSDLGPLPATAPRTLAKINQAQPEDAVIIYFSGHGAADHDRFYLIPHDLGYRGARTNLEGFKMILAHSISDRDLEGALKDLEANQILLLIDACKSGQALKTEEQRRGPMNTRGLAQLAYEKGMYILTASQSDEVAFESEKLKHSYLAYALLEDGIKKGLAVLDGDRTILAAVFADRRQDRRAPFLFHPRAERKPDSYASAFRIRTRPRHSAKQSGHTFLSRMPVAPVPAYSWARVVALLISKPGPTYKRQSAAIFDWPPNLSEHLPGPYPRCYEPGLS